jgi:4-diphosphocytidyl-2-C-methyl-D-erythritol kinase
VSPAPVRVRVEAPAKLNLALAVGPLRPDGFHDLATFFQSVSLTDTLIVEPRPSGFSLRVRYENAAVRGRVRRHPLPTGRDNLVLRAAGLLRDAMPGVGGARFQLVKRIPSRAGLGGGSADAAAALIGLAAAYGRKLSRRQRIDLATRLGADVPFAATGGTALGLGLGERLKRLRLDRPFEAVIALPRWTVSTPQAFARLDRQRKHLTAWGRHLRSVQVLGLDHVVPSRVMRLGNTFESVLGRNRGSFDALVAGLREGGARQVRLTGSGSAVFALLPDGVNGMDFVRRVHVSVPLFLVRSLGRGPVVSVQR